jgi:hypothetical protein
LPMTGEMPTFDLTSLSSGARSLKRVTLGFVISLSVGLILEIMVLTAVSSGRIAAGGLHTAGSQVFLVGVGLGLAGVGVLTATIPRYLPGASQLSVSESGVKLVYPSGGTEKFT